MWKRWQRVLFYILLFIVLLFFVIYGFGTWYRLKHRHEPLELGVSFSASYASSLGLDPNQTLESILKDLHPKRVRLVSYWNEDEPQPGVYDFSELDQQFALLQHYNAKAILSIGLRQPRWPECHMPSWTDNMSNQQWIPLLKKYMDVVVARYKNNPSLGSYQLENEFFLSVFTKCRDNSRSRLVDEFNDVKSLDPKTPVGITVSNDFGLPLPLRKPQADYYPITLYRRVYEGHVLKRYFSYPIPSWWYSFRASYIELTRHRPVVIGELQAEPWTQKSLVDTSLAEQSKAFSQQQMWANYRYAKNIGIRSIDLWGAEWWYWRQKQGDSSYLDIAKAIFREQNQQ